ncbi:unnamed protein product [Rhizoctonia solani]|uniref:Transmembrane protein n=1 Tax=Rhizoctonia solani TaxID=456999 RepID=A0A8H3BM95_9AGAM|nr:unnamed protein product [Rhizoctonia solani]
MSRRFVAPPVESRGSTSSIQTIASPIPSTPRDYLPPPSHPALARPRIPSPGPETYGALNRSPLPPPSHPSRGPSPAPPIPSRTPSHTMHSASVAPIPTHDVAVDSHHPQANTTHSLDSVTTQPEPRLSAGIVSSSNVSTPVLLVTPVTTSGTIDGLPDFQKTEILPPYSPEPNISQTWPVIETPPISAPVPTRPNALGLQNQGHLSMGSLPPPPPSHPSRQPSLAFVDNPGLRQRAHSSTNIGSARTLDSDTLPRRPPLEHSRRGSGASVLTLKDNNLTDDDLRKMYDAEEVERYLRLFASRVNEVAMDPEHPEASTPMQEDDGEWISVSDPGPCVRNPGPLPPHLANPQTFFQYIAAIIYPYVVVPRPQPTETKRKFKLNRAASAAQRLYLAAYPAYVPTLVYLGHLATWRDPRKSALWCAVFWIAWAGGFLSQLIVGRLLYALYTGGHVTRDEIRRRRTAAREAEKLGKAIEGGIPGVGVTGELGVWQVTKLVTGLGKKKGKKVKAAAVEIQNDLAGQAERPEEQAEEMEDWKLMLVDLADELADLHERIKNIFLHRRPQLTRFYIILLSLLFVGTFIIQNTSKIITMVMGFWFWFIPPVIKQLPKLPSPFSDAPTDAEVAMELISKRVERGERVVPERISRRKKTKPVPEPGKLVVPSGTSSRSTVDLTDSSFVMSPSTTSLVDGTSSDDEADVGLVVTSHTSAPQEDKLRKGAVRAWNWLGRTKQLIDQTRGVESKKIYAHASPEQSFPAQHRSRPGMLIISSELLTFTPLFTSSNQSQTPQDPRMIKVDIDHLRGVKKISPGGLSVRYVKGSEVVEEKFLLVVGRDEAFATLVGWGGGRWKNV